MNRQETLTRLKFLSDQVHQTAERGEHLHERMPAYVQAPSLNYAKDLTRVQGEYNRLVRSAEADGLLTPADLGELGLPEAFEQDK